MKSKTLKAIAIILFIIGFSVLPFVCHSQTQDISIKLKKSKGVFVIAGSTAVVGSILNYVANNSKAPVFNSNNTPAEYDIAMKLFDKRNRNLHNASTICYGLSGLALIGITFTF